MMPERAVMTRHLQHDRVRSGSPSRGRHALHVDSVLGEQATDDLAQRIVADGCTDAGRYACCSEGEAGICNASAEGELRRANLVELAGRELGNMAELGSDVDAQMAGDKYRMRSHQAPTRMTSPVSSDWIAAR